jgi:WD40 repeat protein
MELGDGDDDQALKAFLGTTSFGKQGRESNIQAQIDQSKRKDAQSKKLTLGYSSSEDSNGNSDNDEDDDEDDDDEDDEDDEFPVSHELVLKTHEKPVTSVTVDPSGARLISTSTDCTFKLHDFASMTPTTLRAFKSVDPSETRTSASSETHPIHLVSINPLAANQMLVVTAQPQAKIFSRDGELLSECVKGDMYLRDMNNTKGHVAEVTSGAWHPTNRDLFVTASHDSTLRIWDINNPRSQKDVLVFKSKVVGAAGRTRMTAVAWGSQAQGGPNQLIAAALDGSLVLYAGDGPYHRPTAEIRDAHVKDTWTSSIAISGDGRLVVSRGGDDKLKLWDTRKFKQPITVVDSPSMSTQYPTSNIVFSPSSANLIMGSQTGHLHILNPATLRPELSTPVTPGSPLITVNWHPKLNQIITGSANGETHVLYNPTISTNGAKTVMLKAPKRRHVDDDPNLTMDLSHGISDDQIITPGAQPSGRGAASFSARHPTIGLTASGKSRDPRRPHMPVNGPFTKNNPDEKYVKEEFKLSSMRDEDPREALLKYASKPKKDGNGDDDEDEPNSKRMKR